MGRFRGPAQSGLMVVWLALCPRIADAAAPHPDGSVIQRHVLANGLVLLIDERPGSGEAALSVTLRAGSAHEPVGGGGTAHLLEHLTFHGSQSVGSIDWSRERPLLERIRMLSESFQLERGRGASADFSALARMQRQLRQTRQQASAWSEHQALHRAYLKDCQARIHAASTGRDYVQFYALLPSQELACALRLESERMNGLVMRAFHEEKDEILQELRRNRDDPRVFLVQRMLRAELPGHPYARSNWGSEAEIRSLSPQRAVGFYQKLYCPANTVLSIVGDVRTLDAILLAEKFLEGQRADCRTPALPPLPDSWPIPRLEFDSGAQPWLALGWLWPRRGSPHIPALHVLADVLEQDLRASLIDQAGEAAELVVQEFAAGGEAGGVTMIFVWPSTPEGTQWLERHLAERLNMLRRSNISEPSFQQSRSRLIERIRQLRDDPLHYARQIGLAELQTQMADSFTSFEKRLKNLDFQAFRRTAQAYLAAERFVTLLTDPRGGTP